MNVSCVERTTPPQARQPSLPDRQNLSTLTARPKLAEFRLKASTHTPALPPPRSPLSEPALPGSDQHPALRHLAQTSNVLPRRALEDVRSSFLLDGGGGLDRPGGRERGGRVRATARGVGGLVGCWRRYRSGVFIVVSSRRRSVVGVRGTRSSAWVSNGKVRRRVLRTKSWRTSGAGARESCRACGPWTWLAERTSSSA